ncbi:MAG: hypothetical protein ABI844_09640 [Saprospiraceae bacterium]
MFWETWLKHSGEILLALVGAGILGYLWSKWFGSSSQFDSYKAEYESQIFSLNDRIKKQDVDLKNAVGLQSAWASEKTGLQTKIDELSAELNTVNQSFSGFVSPEEHLSLQDRFDTDFKSISTKYDALASEKNSQSATLRDYESKLAMANSQLKSAGELDVKVKDLENRLAASLATKAEIEKQNNIFADQLHSELDAKSSTISKLESQLAAITANTTDIDSYKATLDESTQSIENLKHALQSAEQNLTEKDKEFNSQLALKQGELEKAQNENTSLIARMKDLNESNQSGMSKLHEVSAQVHQLEGELNQAKNEAATYRLQIGDLDKISASLANANINAKDWEARWKELSTEADQYKVAHLNMNKEKDSLKQRLGQVESELISAKTQLENEQNAQANLHTELEAAQSKAHTVEAMVNEFNQKIEASSTSIAGWENKYEELNGNHAHATEKILSLELQLHEMQNHINGHVQKATEWENKYEELNGNHTHATEKILSLELQLQEMQNHINGHVQKATEWENKYEEFQYQIEEKDRKLNTIQTQLNESHFEVERLRGAAQETEHQLLETKTRFDDLTNKYNNVQAHLAEVEKSSTQAAQQFNDAQGKGKEFESKWNDSQNQLGELQKSLAANARKMHDAELNSKEMAEKLKTSEAQLIDAHQSNEKGMNELIASRNKSNELNHQLEGLQNQIIGLQKNLEDTLKEEHDIKIKYRDIHVEYANLESKLAEKEKMTEDYHVQLVDEENKFKELNNKFNTVQLQLADSQRINSHLEGQKKKIRDLDVKYKSEVAAWQKRIETLVKDATSKESILVSRHSAETEKLKKSIIRLEADITNRKNKSLISNRAQASTTKILVPKIAKIAKSTTKLAATVKNTGISKVDWKSISASMGKKVKVNDHTVVEGIGPKINTLLKKAKISSWAQLAVTPVTTIQEVLDKGRKYSLADPSTWNQQAKLAADGKWDELKKLQDTLIGGRKKKVSKPNVLKSVKVKPNKIIVLDLVKGIEIMGSKFKADDLKLIEGIGPKIEQLFHKADIKTWQKLSETNTKTMQEILNKAGTQYSLANPKTWAKQSALAAKGNWKKLKSLQDSLKGGK